MRGNGKIEKRRLVFISVVLAISYLARAVLNTTVEYCGHEWSYF